jgi:hypothetical protein
VRKFATVYIWVLGVFGCIAVIIGITTIVTAFTTTHVQVDRTTTMLTESIEDMEQVVRVLKSHKSEFLELEGAPAAMEATIRQVPQLAAASSDALSATTDTLDKTADLVQAMDGRGDLFMTGSPLKENANALRKTSETLRVLHQRMTETQRSLDRMVADSTRALQVATSVGSALRTSGPRLGDLEERLGAIRRVSESGVVAAGVAGLQIAFGGIYLLVGLLLAGLATGWFQLERRRYRVR